MEHGSRPERSSSAAFASRARDGNVHTNTASTTVSQHKEAKAQHKEAKAQHKEGKPQHKEGKPQHKEGKPQHKEAKARHREEGSHVNRQPP
jgi:hypothetical protein